MSIGTGEAWRDDFDRLQPYLVGRQWGEWEGEYFVKQTTTGIIAVMKKRIDLMAKWHCDWVEFDNMDWAFDEVNRQEYGFRVSDAEAMAYYRELCDYVHQSGMRCMAKNILEGASGFDGVLYESYSDNMDWWDRKGTEDFLKAGKLVIINHYDETACDRVYQDYVHQYGENISFICEDTGLGKYVHYDPPCTSRNGLLKGY
jgi:hypothetical protein